MEEFILRQSELCPLCAADTEPILDDGKYSHCPRCDLRFLHSRFHLPAPEEEARYRTHNNDVNDPAYQAFLEPLYQALRPKLSLGARGLDFGAGPGPVLARRFEQNGFPMSLYDPFFWPDPAPLKDSFDFIVMTEVAEHLYFPRAEFERLFRLLKPGGWLAVMTLLFHSQIDFSTWHYRRDPTHVVFYSRQTFDWLARELGFGDLTCSGERIVLLERPVYVKTSAL